MKVVGNSIQDTTGVENILLNSSGIPSMPNGASITGQTKIIPTFNFAAGGSGETVDSTSQQYRRYTPSAAIDVTFDNSIAQGQWFEIINAGTVNAGIISLKANDSSTIATLGYGRVIRLIAAVANPATSTDWVVLGLLSQTKAIVLYEVSGSTANPSFSTGAFEIVDFDTKILDQGAISGDLVTTGASWQFTAPRNGVYVVSAFLKFAASATWSNTENVQLQVKKNGSTVIYSSFEYPHPDTTAPSDSINAYVRTSHPIVLNADDTISLLGFQNTAATLALSTSSGDCQVGIYELSQN